MISKDILNTITNVIQTQDVSVASVARRLKKSSQALNQQLNNSDIKVSKLLEIIEAIHCDITITITDRATGQEYKIN